MIEMTKKQLAELAGITYRQLYNINQKLPEEAKLFVSAEGGKGCDAALFVQRWVDYNVSSATAGLDDLDAVKAVHEKIKTRKTELEVARMEGTLVDVQDVRRLWGDIANTIMQGLIHLPSTVAPILQGQTNVEIIASVLDEEIRKALNALTETPLPAYALLQDSREDEED